jgi:uncharacterized protein (UPF0264 family)
MRLLVSVASAAEALAALEGGADIIDAKEPRAGALGAVATEVLRDIHGVVDGRRLVSAALGDAGDEAIECTARTFVSNGAALVKVGFAGISDPGTVEALVAAAVRGAVSGSAGVAGVVAVAYADSERASSIEARSLVRAAARGGAVGVLLDTADKSGPGVRGLLAAGPLSSWAAEAHAAGLFVAVAGKLTAADLPFVSDAGADIVGVRGAACDGGRTGRVSVDKVRRLRALCEVGLKAFPTAAMRLDRCHADL